MTTHSGGGSTSGCFISLLAIALGTMVAFDHLTSTEMAAVRLWDPMYATTLMVGVTVNYGVRHEVDISDAALNLFEGSRPSWPGPSGGLLTHLDWRSARHALNRVPGCVESGERLSADDA